MMKRIGFLMCFILFFVGCYEEDIEKLRKDLDGQDARIGILEVLQRYINEDINALRNLVNAQQQGMYIRSVTPTSEGYLIKLSDGTELPIRHGAKGEQGDKGETGTPGSGV